MRYIPGLIAKKRNISTVQYFFVYDALEILLWRRSEDAEYVIQLIEVVFAGEYRSSREHLRQDAADRPDIYGLVVALHRENYIRFFH